MNFFFFKCEGIDYQLLCLARNVKSSLEGRNIILVRNLNLYKERESTENRVSGSKLKPFILLLLGS